MNWRDLLGQTGSTGESYTHNSHNTQNPSAAANTLELKAPATMKSGEVESRLLEALNRICAELPIAPRTVLDALSPQDLADWRDGTIDDRTLQAFATSLSWRVERERGQRVGNDTERAFCRQCGPIWSRSSATVDVCPWCRNRRSGRPIPRPVKVTCGTCTKFQKDPINPATGLGRCVEGRHLRSLPCFPRILRVCDYWLPRRPEEDGSGDPED